MLNHHGDPKKSTVVNAAAATALLVLAVFPVAHQWLQDVSLCVLVDNLTGGLPTRALTNEAMQRLTGSTVICSDVVFVKLPQVRHRLSLR